MTFDQWVDLATAIGTVVAAATAVALGVAAERRSRADREKVSALEAERRAADRERQAQRIAIWADEGPTYEGRGIRQQYKVWVHNASDLPVFDVWVPWVYYNTATGEQEKTRWYVSALVPGHTRELDLTHESWHLSNAFVVNFRDNAGVCWTRNLEGGLEERTGST